MVCEEAMEMSAPFFKFGLFSESISLVIAFVIGIGFGFFLERAGFGSARKLTAQFYLTDMAVFKVMFTAIVTAMLGVFYLGWIGFLDVSLIYVTPTYLFPQIAGGLILGVGFAVGGYCPGTACVAVSSAKIDALVYVAGVIAGIFIFGEAFPIVKGFYNATPMGQITLPQLLHLPYGLIVLFVALMAVGGFAGATWVEKTMAAKKGKQRP
jgi:uncharacterized protein